jgi:hypothetical protein
MNLNFDETRVASDGLFYCVPWMRQARERLIHREELIEQYEEALAWVLKHFNTFAQPPEHLKSIVDAACLKAMTADEDAVKMTANDGEVKP